ncbi:hypothetical protein [Rummeliibacillus sp. TYF-LIM-RU47]|uniref:hypothetical protein n=1 Tax=Rummeliibacillus sp. TYF-LIM-RU47 TaxID=2608406 RepID=UPI001CC25251|nr:hypothetical protein [Rummeliibacillus sp. TYF-LIM-RU47]
MIGEDIMLENNVYGEWLSTINELRDFSADEITFLYRWNVDLLDSHKHVEMNIINSSEERGEAFEINTREHGTETILRRDVLTLTTDTKFIDDKLWDIIYMLQELIEEGKDRL